MTTSMDRHARKQVLLTRIAFDRSQLRNDIARVSQAARLPNLLRGVVGGTVARSLFGAPSVVATRGGWVGLALTLLRRYKVAASLIATAAPLVRGRGRWQRLLRLASIHVDSPRGPVHLVFVHRDVAEVRPLLAELVDRARAGRGDALPDRWMASRRD